MTPPVQKPGKSEQSVQTPVEFLDAVKRLLGIEKFSWDLAAEPHNAVTDYFFSKAVGSALDQEWFNIPGWLWLNPPFGKLEQWVYKATNEKELGAKIAMLVPASVGSKWWFTWVGGYAQIYYLHPRITFVGHKSPYPKDLALLIFRPGVYGGHSNWDWK